MHSTKKWPAVHTLVPAAIIIVGALLMIGKIVADSEPGGIPILMILVGAGWYIVLRIRSRSNQT